MQDTKGTGIQEKELAKSSRAEDNEECFCSSGGGGLCSPTRSGSAVQRGKRECENIHASIWGAESVISEGNRLPTYLYTHLEGVKTILICG